MQTQTATKPKLDGALQKEEHLDLEAIFKKHKDFYQSNPFPSLEYRTHLLQKLKAELLQIKDELCNAVHQDFGNRCASETLLLEVMQVIDHINHTCRHLKHWMKPETRVLPIQLMPGSSMVLPQPKGVVGIISPWNYPILLSLSPLVTALSAGNTALLKASELTPHTNRSLEGLCNRVFDGKNATLVEGGSDLAARFSALPFNHLFFTGSPEIGQKVMAAAASNLTPVTLELGGKSPVIIGPDYDIAKAADAICFGKSINAGQTCIAPDYVLCPADKVESFTAAMARSFQKMYPSQIENEDYTSIISKNHFERLNGLLEDAQQKGAKIMSLGANEEPNAPKKKIPLTLVQDITSSMRISSEEIFGPLLPIIPVETMDAAINYVESAHPPLALYLMSDNPKLHHKVKISTHAGGMCINDTLTHVASQNLPFGGMGRSGIGRYHGHEGFLELSHSKAILKRGRWNPTLLIAPPWNKKIHQMIMKVFIK